MTVLHFCCEALGSYNPFSSKSPSDHFKLLFISPAPDLQGASGGAEAQEEGGRPEVRGPDGGPQRAPGGADPATLRAVRRLLHGGGRLRRSYTRGQTPEGQRSYVANRKVNQPDYSMFGGRGGGGVLVCTAGVHGRRARQAMQVPLPDTTDLFNPAKCSLVESNLFVLCCSLCLCSLPLGPG